MRKWRFYWECVKFAFRGGWGITDTIAGLVAIVAGIILWLFAPLGVVMNILIWAIPLVVFIITFFTRLVLAPYTFYDTKHKEAKHLGDELDKIKVMTPHFVLRKVDESYYGNITTTMFINNRKEQVIEHPYFTRVWIANEPIKPEYAAEARYVYCEIDFWNESCQNRLFYMGGGDGQRQRKLQKVHNQ